MYPNPFDAKLTFEIKTDKSSMVKLELCNMMGQVFQVIVNERLLPGVFVWEVETAQLPDGIYFMRLTMDENNYSERIVKIH